MLSKLSDVSLRDLEVFVMAAKAHSLREVARQLNLLPAHTSKIIKGLENKLGTPLFRRSVAGIILTPEGIIALEAAEKICEIAQEIVPDSQRQNPSSEKLWTFGSIGFLSTYLLGPIACGICKESDVIKFDFIVPTDWGSHGYTIGEDFCPLSVRRRRKGNEAATAETALEMCRHSDQLTFVPEILAQNWCKSGFLKEIHVENWPVQEKEIFLSVKTDTVPRSLMEAVTKGLKKHPAMTPRS